MGMAFRKVSERSFALDINPAVLTTAQQKGVRIITAKNGKPFPTFYKKKKSIQNERMIKFALKPFAPKDVLMNDGDTAVMLDIVYYFPHTSGTPKWKKDCLSFMTQRPDVDNLSKAFVDCMTDIGFWEDDSMVNIKHCKFRYPNPHIHLKYEIWRQERES